MNEDSSRFALPSINSFQIISISSSLINHSKRIKECGYTVRRSLFLSVSYAQIRKNGLSKWNGLIRIAASAVAPCVMFFMPSSIAYPNGLVLVAKQYKKK